MTLISGSSSPSLLSNGTILQVGKSHTGYLLSQANLGGIGHELASAGMCGGDVDGGDAVVGDRGVHAVRKRDPG